MPKLVFCRGSGSRWGSLQAPFPSPSTPSASWSGRRLIWNLYTWPSGQKGWIPMVYGIAKQMAKSSQDVVGVVLWLDIHQIKRRVWQHVIMAGTAQLTRRQSSTPTEHQLLLPTSRCTSKLCRGLHWKDYDLWNWPGEGNNGESVYDKDNA